MRNFKKILLMCLALFLVENLFSFCLSPVTLQHTFEKELRWMERNHKEPNMVVLGDSTIYAGLVPARMEKTLPKGINVINAGTGSQQVWGSYYYLKDILRQYDIDYVVLGIDQWAFTKQSESIKRDLLIIDRIKDPLIKMEFVYSVFEPEQYPYLLKSYANRNEWENIAKNIKQKCSRAYWEEISGDKKVEDFGRGFMPNGNGIKETDIGIQSVDVFSEETINPAAMEYLDKITELCASGGISLYMVSMPIISTAIHNTGSYANFDEYFRAYASKHSVTYWDLNLLKDRLEFIPDTDMTDTVHIGEVGAEKISERLGGLIAQDVKKENTADEFWKNVDEFKRSCKGIIGCDLKTEPIEGTADRQFFAKSIQAEGVKPEYSFWVSNDSESGKWILLQDYGISDNCVIPGKYLENDIWLKVCVREVGRADEYEKCCIRMRSPEMSD